MTTFYIKQTRCPHCEKIFGYRAVGSCNTFGARFYTDGYLEGPYYVRDPQFLFCPHCGELNWLEDLEATRVDGEESSLPIAQAVLIDQYPAMLEQEPWDTPQREKRIRMGAWWASNNRRFRRTSGGVGTHPVTAMTPFEKENLEKLLKLLNDSHPDEALYKAEAFRELGNFEECTKQLEKVTDEQLTHYKTFISNLVAEQISDVVAFEGDDRQQTKTSPALSTDEDVLLTGKQKRNMPYWMVIFISWAVFFVFMFILWQMATS